jgi:hypothetical protein
MLLHCCRALPCVLEPAKCQEVISVLRFIFCAFVFRKAYGESRDSSVGIALGYGLYDRGSRFRFPAAAGNFSLHLRVQNGSGAHPAPSTMGTMGSFPGGKAAGA